MELLYLKLLISILSLVLLSRNGFAQIELIDSIRLEILDNSEPLPGVSVRIKYGNPNYGTITDISGNALLLVPKSSDKIILSFLGPNFEFKIYRPVDFIRIDLHFRTIIYYSDGLKLKKIKFKRGF